MNALTEAVVTIAMGILGVAMLAVLVSRNAKTAEVIQAGASGFGNALNVAISPVTGNNARTDLSYPGGGWGFRGPSFGGAANFSFN